METGEKGKQTWFPWLARLEHFTWANFTLPMATGGLALLLADQTQGFTFRGLQTIGKIVYVLDLVIFTLVASAITYRFVKFPGTLKKSIVHPTEGLFLGTSTLSLASIISGIARYGIPSCGPWLITVYRILFWTYFAITFIIAVGQYALLFASPKFKLSDMTPAYDLPVFPFMLSGTIAAIGSSLQPPDQAIPIIVAGLGAQGFGLLVSIFIYACYVHRLIQYGFPSPNSRPGMFIAVGPPAFTGLALIGLADSFPVHYNSFGPDEITIQILRVLATTVCIFIWFLSLWFFCIAAVANLAVWREITFHLNWYSYIFPNVGFTIAVISIGKTLNSPGMIGTGSAMTALLVIGWLVIVLNHIRAVWTGQILADGKDEDYYVNEKKHPHLKIPYDD
ncbi:voltage-dependent anion channel [Hypoxylon argillaceum]|nr:voltage-dependent anion channel [Hypoxylon argillaceum]KAI1147123.1 voltage-dependent anion channel [Nemania diffusa]